jgi:hypothetical protein
MFSKTQQLKWTYWYPISVEIEVQLRRLRRFVDRLYLRIWPLILALWVALVLVWGTLQFKHDYDLIHNYANIDALNEGIYSTWRTDGNPGQEPPTTK